MAALSGDRHTLPTTMATAALKEDHWHVEHLGADVPIEELEAFVAEHHIDVAVISTVTPKRALAEQAKNRLEALGLPTIVGSPGTTLTELQSTARSALRQTH